ncbi:universal stress protein [Streptomyces sp. NPDC048506]|uniref:universal stress protein n=1 Tax=Streptomyces sp. NPDC048506 TaxID=3155028 RepID=UPI0034246FE9
MTEPIVVGVDGSGRSLRALVWAAHEAALRRCALHIIHVLPREHGYAGTLEDRVREESRRDQGVVAEATAIVQEAHPDLEVTSALPSGAPAAVLLAESERAHTVVLGAKGLGGFGSLLLGSVALQVVGHAASPVVIVNHVTTGHRRIVVGADGSAHSRAACVRLPAGVPARCRTASPACVECPTSESGSGSGSRCPSDREVER